MRKAKLARVIALVMVLAALLATAACRPASETKAQAQIQSLISARENGVNAADQAEYLSTVLPSDAPLTKEETNLIRASSGLGVKDYKLTAGDVQETADGEITATLSQSYTQGGQARRCSYTALFRQENGRLYYDGPDFGVKQNAAIRVCYDGARDAALAQKLLNEETDTLAVMKSQLGFTPTETVSIKLYDDQQVFLQSVKLDLPGWVGGWHEYGESIKSFTGAYGSDAAEYKSMLNHETTHLMVSELTNDNASYWLQEGIAGVYQDRLDNPGAPPLTSAELSASYTGIAEQKQIDLEKLGVDDQAAVEKYYATSKAFVAFLLDRYGWDKVRAMLEYMKKFELLPVTSDEKIGPTNDRTDEAISAVLGFKTDAAFQAAFDEWFAGKAKS